MDYFNDFPGGMHDQRVYQQGIDLAHAESATRRVRDEAEQLRRSLDRLRLASAAMWELMREQHGLRDEDLLAKIREIDLRDGVLDGRMRPAPRACPGCERVNKATRTACLYCGLELGSPPPV